MSQQKNILAELVAIIASMFLAVIKFFVFLISGSLAVLSAAIDSFFDAAISSMNLFIIRKASELPDEDHSFGHGKFEAFAGLIEGFIVAAGAGFILWRAFVLFWHPQEIESEVLAVGVMLFSVLVVFLLTIFMKSIAKKTKSVVIKADILHFSSDIISNLGVFLVLLLSYFWQFTWLDPVISILIALWILRLTWGLLKESFAILTDKEIENEEKEKIVNILRQAQDKKEINDWHFLRTRRVGSQVHVDGHLVFDEDISLKEAHDIGDKITEKIQKRIENSFVVFHFDPYDDSDENQEMLLKIHS